MWENDRRHGQGTFTAANGDMCAPTRSSSYDPSHNGPSGTLALFRTPSLMRRASTLGPTAISVALPSYPVINQLMRAPQVRWRVGKQREAWAGRLNVCRRQEVRITNDLSNDPHDEAPSGMLARGRTTTCTGRALLLGPASTSAPPPLDPCCSPP